MMEIKIRGPNRLRPDNPKFSLKYPLKKLVVLMRNWLGLARRRRSTVKMNMKTISRRLSNHIFSTIMVTVMTIQKVVEYRTIPKWL